MNSIIMCNASLTVTEPFRILGTIFLRIIAVITVTEENCGFTELLGSHRTYAPIGAYPQPSKTNAHSHLTAKEEERWQTRWRLCRFSIAMS